MSAVAVISVMLEQYTWLWRVPSALLVLSACHIHLCCIGTTSWRLHVCRWCSCLQFCLNSVYCVTWNYFLFVSLSSTRKDCRYVLHIRALWHTSACDSPQHHQLNFWHWWFIIFQLRSQWHELRYHAFFFLHLIVDYPASHTSTVLSPGILITLYLRELTVGCRVAASCGRKFLCWVYLYLRESVPDSVVCLATRWWLDVICCVCLRGPKPRSLAWLNAWLLFANPVLCLPCLSRSVINSRWVQKFLIQLAAWCWTVPVLLAWCSTSSTSFLSDLTSLSIFMPAECDLATSRFLDVAFFSWFILGRDWLYTHLYC